MTDRDSISEFETTDEIAQLMGFPNADLYRLDGELAKLADRYNETRDPEALKQHQDLYNKMLDMGMTPLMFSADTEVFLEVSRRSHSDDLKDT